MFTVIKTIGINATARRELVPGIAAFLMAEFFYKFHSFSLECLAFLATWFTFSFACNFAVMCFRGNAVASGSGARDLR